MIWRVLTVVWGLALASLLWTLTLVVSEWGFSVIEAWPLMWLATFVVGLLGGRLGRKSLNAGCALSLLACAIFLAFEDFHGFHLFWRADHVSDVFGFYSRHPRRAFDSVLLPLLVIFCAGWVAWHWYTALQVGRGDGGRAGL